MIKINLAILLLNFSFFGFSTIDEMNKQRKEFLKNLTSSLLNGSKISLTEFEEKYEEIKSTHVAFCRQKNVNLYDFLLKEKPEAGDFDVQELKKACLISLRTWQINTEKKFFKYRRTMLRDLLNREIKSLQELERKKIEKIVKDYSSYL